MWGGADGLTCGVRAVHSLGRCASRRMRNSPWRGAPWSLKQRATAARPDQTKLLALCFVEPGPPALRQLVDVPSVRFGPLGIGGWVVLELGADEVTHGCAVLVLAESLEELLDHLLANIVACVGPGLCWFVAHRARLGRVGPLRAAMTHT